MTPLLLSLAFGLALASPFVCVAYWAQRVHTRQVAHYECRLHALRRDCALKQEMLDRLAEMLGVPVAEVPKPASKPRRTKEAAR